MCSPEAAESATTGKEDTEEAMEVQESDAPPNTDGYVLITSEILRRLYWMGFVIILENWDVIPRKGVPYLFDQLLVVCNKQCNNMSTAGFSAGATLVIAFHYA